MIVILDIIVGTLPKPQRKLYQVWTAGYRATGEHGLAQYHGECYAYSFIEACKRLLGHEPSFEIIKPLEVPSETARKGLERMGLNQETTAYLWICKCYDNEQDARRDFG